MQNAPTIISKPHPLTRCSCLLNSYKKTQQFVVWLGVNRRTCSRVSAGTFSLSLGSISMTVCQKKKKKISSKDLFEFHLKLKQCYTIYVNIYSRQSFHPNCSKCFKIQFCKIWSMTNWRVQWFMVFSQIIGSATQVFSRIYKESKIALTQEINVYL